MKKKKTILNDQDFKRIITRISHEIIEKHKGTQNLALVGIQTRGDFLAKRLVDRGHRGLPIQADYKGISINTEHQDMINVLVVEHDNQDMVYIEQD